jgi:hypothetical protein
MIGAFPSPSAMSTMRLASRIVAMPIVTARSGTCSSPKKSLAASWRVTRSSVIRRVRLKRPEPGSLKPTWPVRPIPSSCRSIPPCSRIRRSYSSQCACTAFAGTVPDGRCTFAGSTSMWSKRCSRMKRW